MRDEALVARMIERRDNPAYLPGIRVPDAVEPTGSLEEALAGAAIVISAVPSQFARDVYGGIAASLPGDVPVLVTCKGIEERTLELPLEVAAGVLGGEQRLAMLSGPSFALEVAEGRPTAVVVAAGTMELARSLQGAVASRELRIYTNLDPLGVQLLGALKNVIAIAVGIADSLEMGTNARAALITRGLAEMSRLVTACGGKAATAAGLAGMGDLARRAASRYPVGQPVGGGRRAHGALGPQARGEGRCRDADRRRGAPHPLRRRSGSGGAGSPAGAAADRRGRAPQGGVTPRP
jgi:glycerol-3-phosphate dehydrogenase (NAD(P)+)